MDGGVALIDEPDELAQVRRQAKRVRLRTVIAAVTITALLLLLP